MFYAGTTAAVEDKSAFDTPVVVKDKDRNVDPDSVKAPGLMERAKEEVEAMAEALQEKLDLNKSSDEPTSAAAPEAATAEKSDKPAKEHKDEQTSVFKRLLKKFGLAKN